jgi:CBS domain containing-hemolysin-like protein
VACLLLVSLTAATEAVLAQITRQQLRKGLEVNGRAARSVEQLLARPHAYGSAMTLLRTLGAVAFVTLIASIFLRQQIPGGIWAAFGISALLLLIIGHSLPRGMARRSVESAATGLSGFAILATALATPLLFFYDILTRVALFLARRPRTSVMPEPIDEEELQAVLGPEYTNGEQIEEGEREMIDAILGLEDRTARDIMVPRLDIVAVPEEATVPEIVAIIRRAGHSRVPVYRGAIDNIIGVVYAKDLLRFVPENTAAVPLTELMRPIERDLIVPESKPVDVLLREMRSRKRHLALVLDEYGGTAGILTIEDILEEIVGEINDEHDPTIAPEIEEISEHELLVDGRASAESVSDWLNLHWTEDEEHPTLGGLVQRELGRLPEAGEEVAFDGAHITVLAVEGHRIKRLRVEKLALGQTSQSNGNGNGNGHHDHADRAGSATDAAK